MGNLRVFGNRRPEIAIIKQTIQFTLFLIVCLWLLYQIHLSLYVSRDSGCYFIDDRVIDERIVKLLGRKTGLGKSHYAEEMELYGVDLIGEAVTINNNASDSDSDVVDDNQFGNPVAEENDEREHVESGIVEGKKVNQDSTSAKKLNLKRIRTGLSYYQSLAPFIVSGSDFDTHYYKSLLLGRGLLYADQQLMSNAKTARLVEVFASDDGSIFRREFSKAMLKMSNLQS